MDWLDEKIERIALKFKMVSLKNALQLYILVGIFAVVILSLLTVIICENWLQLIIYKYKLFSVPFGQEYIHITETYASMQMSDKILSTIINIISNFSPIVYSIISIIIISKLYYKNKLEEPLNILKEEARRITQEDYSFECVYETKDEMGEICETFNNMRLQLVENKKSLWRQINDERKLKEVFAHDLRTPLTVLRGYVELLLKYYPNGKISEDKMIETLDLMKNQVERLENFSNIMKKINTLEELELHKVSTNSECFINVIESVVNGINNTQDKKIEISILDLDGEVVVDIPIIILVLENLLSNALRYSNQKIGITIKSDGDFLSLYVKDDGKGFTVSELNKAYKPYYTSAEGEEHYGLGLAICKLLSEKHGGNLSLFNSIDCGAIVCCNFFIK